MLDLRPHRRLAAAAAGVTAALAVAATPALATEGPAAPPPPPPPWTLTPPSFSAPPGFAPGTVPSVSAKHRKPSIRKAKLVPRRIRVGKRSTLKLSLPQAGRVQYTVTRVSRPGRGPVAMRRVAVPSGAVSIRLPRSAKGGRYRVTAVVVDGAGERSRKISRSLVVRPAHR